MGREFSLDGFLPGLVCVFLFWGEKFCYAVLEPVFDLFNGYCYNGEEVIRPENLRELDTTSIVLPYGADGAVSPQQKDRDVLKMLLKTDGKAAYCILGVENQSESCLRL